MTRIIIFIIIILIVAVPLLKSIRQLASYDFKFREMYRIQLGILVVVSYLMGAFFHWIGTSPIFLRSIAMAVLFFGLSWLALSRRFWIKIIAIIILLSLLLGEIRYIILFL